jgi:hypothetical protein
VVTAAFDLFLAVRVGFSAPGFYAHGGTTRTNLVSKLENRSIEDKFIRNTEVFEHPFRSLLPDSNGRIGAVDIFSGL